MIKHYAFIIIIEVIAAAFGKTDTIVTTDSNAVIRSISHQRIDNQNAISVPANASCEFTNSTEKNDLIKTKRGIDGMIQTDYMSELDNRTDSENNVTRRSDKTSAALEHPWGQSIQHSATETVIMLVGNDDIPRNKSRYNIAKGLGAVEQTFTLRPGDVSTEKNNETILNGAMTKNEIILPTVTNINLTHGTEENESDPGHNVNDTNAVTDSSKTVIDQNLSYLRTTKINGTRENIGNANYVLNNNTYSLVPRDGISNKTFDKDLSFKHYLNTNLEMGLSNRHSTEGPLIQNNNCTNLTNHGDPDRNATTDKPNDKINNLDYSNTSTEDFTAVINDSRMNISTSVYNDYTFNTKSTSFKHVKSDLVLELKTINSVTEELIINNSAATAPTVNNVSLTNIPVFPVSNNSNKDFISSTKKTELPTVGTKSISDTLKSTVRHLNTFELGINNQTTDVNLTRINNTYIVSNFDLNSMSTTGTETETVTFTDYETNRRYKEIGNKLNATKGKKEGRGMYNGTYYLSNNPFQLKTLLTIRTHHPHLVKSQNNTANIHTPAKRREYPDHNKISTEDTGKRSNEDYSKNDQVCRCGASCSGECTPDKSGIWKTCREQIAKMKEIVFNTPFHMGNLGRIRGTITPSRLNKTSDPGKLPVVAEKRSAEENRCPVMVPDLLKDAQTISTKEQARENNASKLESAAITYENNNKTSEISLNSTERGEEDNDLANYFKNLLWVMTQTFVR